MKILVFNAGSSSLKSHLYELTGPEIPEEAAASLWSLQIDWSHRDTPARLRVKTASGKEPERQVPIKSLRGELLSVIETLCSGEARVIADRREIEAVGHRVVHGGELFRESTRITPEVAQAIDSLSIFAPAHNAVEFDIIEIMEGILGREIPHVAVFDTAFHSTLPPVAYLYGGPYEWLAQGIRRYGFHGISHQYVALRAARILKRDPELLCLVTCHLGSGCSLAAVQGGRSIDTTMGFTPLDGLIMGTRSGSVDPGILIYLMRQGDFDAAQLDRVLNRESGLRGISGISGDMRQIEAAMAQEDARARLAFDAYVHRLRSQISAMVASLGRLDALIFTAGVGENSAPVRAAVCSGLGFLGVKLDDDRNSGSPRDQDIAAADSQARILVIHTEEDWQIARECFRVIHAPRGREGREDQ